MHDLGRNVRRVERSATRLNVLVLLVAGLLVFYAGPAPAATVLFCPFDSLEGWSVRTAGAGSAAIVDKPGAATRCVEVTSRRGTALLTRELPLEAVRGCRVTVSCLVKGDRIVRGAQASSTAKLHLAVRTPGGIRHHHARFVGTSDWHREGFTADVPPDAERVVLNLGLEACFGRALFDRLVVRNDQRGVQTLSLASTVNGSHEQLGLAVFPKETVRWEDLPFQIVDAAQHDGGDCLRLGGVDHPDWPQATASPIPVNSGASAVYILHGALDGREKNETPCAIWSARFAGGSDAGMSIFEGRQIGAIGQTGDLENWHVAWRGRDPSGGWVTFGVTKWTIYSDEPILWLSCQAYRGASPVILAVTVVEEPPPPPAQPGQYDEMGDPWDINE